MAINVEATLQAAVTHSHLGVVVAEALRRRSEGSWETSQSGSSLPASHYAKIWKFRQEMGRFDPLRVLGVPETVASLEATEGQVGLAVLESGSGGSIAVWVDDHDKLVGLILGGSA